MLALSSIGDDSCIHQRVDLLVLLLLMLGLIAADVVLSRLLLLSLGSLVRIVLGHGDVGLDLPGLSNLSGLLLLGSVSLDEHALIAGSRI